MYHTNRNKTYVNPTYFDVFVSHPNGQGFVNFESRDYVEVMNEARQMRAEGLTVEIVPRSDSSLYDSVKESPSDGEENEW